MDALQTAYDVPFILDPTTSSSLGGGREGVGPEKHLILSQRARATTQRPATAATTRVKN